ncbi:MAG: hypothetical protein GX564_03585 [Oligosphaeraceae bacterium]|nr:hypothetical protein [Oligosphaeraceae bacterium]
MMSQLLTALTKQKAFSLGADMVGVANIERWANAPLLMSPPGLMPEGKSVIVCAIHHTDGMIEIGGEGSPHQQGSYSYQYFMNTQLDVISYNLARFLEDQGYKAIPITASNIWRYREYKGLDSTFAPDMSHIYASVCAGLTEMGYSGIAMSPEYGPRNRFVSIITDAPLTPDPLLPGNTLCDRCGQCLEHCCAYATTQEVQGTVSLAIEGHTYTFAKKNLWRCAWSEHFGLNSEAEIPPVVNEQVILDKLKELGMRGGTMGCCIKYCLPRDKRSWNKEYSSAPIRKKSTIPSRPNPDRGIQQQLLANALAYGASQIVIQNLDDWNSRGIDLKPLLPDARSIIFFQVAKPTGSALENSTNFHQAAGYIMNHGAFYYAAGLEKLGYSAAPYFLGRNLRESAVPAMDCVIAEATKLFGQPDHQALGFTLTSAALAPLAVCAEQPPQPSQLNLTGIVKKLACEFGADLVGISSSQRVSRAVESIRKDLDQQEVLDITETGSLWLSSTVEVKTRLRRLHTPEEHLAGARSVIVLGIRTPLESSECLGRRPAEAVGPYTFAQYESRNLLNYAALRLIQRLSAWGIQAYALNDLENTASCSANPRGLQPNIFANRISAVCAGLGTLTKGGFINTPEYGTNVRFVTIVVDCELQEDQLADLQTLRRKCQDCNRCLEHCTVKAFKGLAQLNLEGQTLSFNIVEQKRCDWAIRFGLVAAEGQQWTGSKTDVPPPEDITPAALAEAMTKRDPILRVRPCSSEMCVMACPYTRTQTD